MSEVAPGGADAEAPASPDAALAGLRAEIDRLDEALHDLLMARAEVVARVAAEGGKGRVALRPGREAAILRHLLARHRGGLPAQCVVRVWRELLAGTTAMQTPTTIAAAEPEPGVGTVALAREHFGALTPLRAHRSAAQAIGDLAAGRVAAVVLPLPAEGEPAPWWPGLMHRTEPRLYVVARLPFWAPRPEGAPRAQALVLATVPPDPSGEDRTLLGLEFAPTLSRTRVAELVAAAGFAEIRTLFWRAPGGDVALAMLDVAGFVREDDARLAALAAALAGPRGGVPRPPVVLGAYATPVPAPAATGQGENP